MQIESECAVFFRWTQRPWLAGSGVFDWIWNQSWASRVQTFTSRLHSLHTQTHIYLLDHFSLNSQSDFRWGFIETGCFVVFSLQLKPIVWFWKLQRQIVYASPRFWLFKLSPSSRTYHLHSRQVDVRLTGVCDGTLSCLLSRRVLLSLQAL